MFGLLDSIVPGKTQGAIATTALILLTMIAVFIALTVGHLRELHRWSEVYEEESQRLREAQKEVERWKERRELATSDYESEKRIRALLMLKPGERVIYLKPMSK